MTDRLNIALDDVIKQQRKEKKTSKPSKKPFKSQNRGRQNKSRNASNQRPKIFKKLSPTSAPSAREKAKQLRSQKVRGYNPSGAQRGAANQSSSKESNTKPTKIITIHKQGGKTKFSTEHKEKRELSTRLKVMNLSASISNEDLNVLFGEVGKLVECRRDYDEFGRVIGSATVAYQKAEDATRAYKEYNKAELDDNVLVIEYLK